VINEVDETLRSLFKNEVLSGTDVDVVFDAPTRDWATRRNKPTVNVYLYDIREDTRRQQFGETEIRDEGGRVVQRLEPPRFFKLSYLVTAWTQRPEDEHRLLSIVLASMLQHPYLPEEHLTELLVEHEISLLMKIAFPHAEDRQVPDVWTALGGDLKPSLDLQIDMPVRIDTLGELAALVIAPLKVQASAINTFEAEDDIKQLRRAETEPAVP
jgi:Pvc16 N-terminal domain